MRIKIKDTWYECEDDQPIMIVLDDHDKENIRNMSENDAKYALFTNNCPLTIDEKIEWME